MKKIILLLAALLPFVMVSCEKPEKGSDDVVGTSGKMLVKKMTAKGTLASHDNDDDDGYYDYYRSQSSQKIDATFTFAYADGKMSRLSASGSYANVYDEEQSYNGNVVKNHEEENFSGKGKVSFTYNGDVMDLGITVQGESSGKDIYEPDRYDENEEWSESGSLSGNYILNMENGIAVSGKGTFKSDEGTYTTDKIKFGYDNSDQLTSLYYEGEYEYRTEIKWQNGNMVNVGWYDDDDYKAGKKHPIMRPLGKKRAKAAKSGSIVWHDWLRVEYSSKENKSNIDISRIIFTYLATDYPEMGIGVFGFLGKESKNLPSKVYANGEDWNEETGEYEEKEVEYLSFDYEFNKDGAVKKIKISSPVEGYDKANATIEFEY